MENRHDSGTYKKVSVAVDLYLAEHKGETFDLDMICRHLDLSDAQLRHDAVRKLSYELGKKGQQLLEKSNRLYKVLDNTITYIDWVNADASASFPVLWPCSHQEPSSFGFEGFIKIAPRDLIVLGGETNKGKTAMCLNILWDNMDDHPCTLMGNEYTPSRFKSRISRMTWRDPLDGKGKPKFDLIEAFSDWKYKIKPDNLNIIDWISLEGEHYMIDSVLKGIQERLEKGIAVISLQKSEGSNSPVGGHFAEDRASVVLTMMDGHLKVKKAKEWSGFNPNGKMWAYDIQEGGTQFVDIHEVASCHKCAGSGKFRGGVCDICNGKTYIEVKRPWNG
jgi:hypothetical protein